jgi:hypothetical protein
MKHYIVYSVPVTADYGGEWSFESAINQSVKHTVRFPAALDALRGFTLHPNRYRANQHIRKTSSLARYAVRRDYSHQIDPDEILRVYPSLKTEIKREIYVGKTRPVTRVYGKRYTTLKEIWVLEVHNVLTGKPHIQDFILSLVGRATFTAELMMKFLVTHYDSYPNQIWEGNIYSDPDEEEET